MLHALPADELEAARTRGEALARLEHDRDTLLESNAGMVGEALEDLAPEEHRRIYKLLRLEVRFRPDWPLDMSGLFAGETGRPRMVCHTAIFHHLAYKGSMSSHKPEGADLVR